VSIPNNLLSAYAGVVEEIGIGLTEYRTLGLQPALESERQENALVVFCRGECAHTHISIYVDQPANIIVRYGTDPGDAAKYTMSQVDGKITFERLYSATPDYESFEAIGDLCASIMRELRETW